MASKMKTLAYSSAKSLREAMTEKQKTNFANWLFILKTTTDNQDTGLLSTGDGFCCLGIAHQCTPGIKNQLKEGCAPGALNAGNADLLGLNACISFSIFAENAKQVLMTKKQQVMFAECRNNEFSDIYPEPSLHDIGIKMNDTIRLNFSQIADVYAKAIGIEPKALPVVKAKKKATKKKIAKKTLKKVSEKAKKVVKISKVAKKAIAKTGVKKGNKK